MTIKTELSKRARDLAKADNGLYVSWADELKRGTLSASESEFGYLIVSVAVLEAARDEWLDNLAQRYKKAERLLAEGDYRSAEQAFRALGDYSDAATRAKGARDKEEQRVKEEKARLKRNEAEYLRAEELVKQRKYDQARKSFESLGSFKDSERRANDISAKEKQYQVAKRHYDKGDYFNAEQEFKKLGDYKKSKSLSASARRERMRDSELKRAVEIDGTIVELRKEKATYVGYKNKLVEAQRLSKKSGGGGLFDFVKDSALFWGGLIVAALFFLYGNGDPAGQAERYPILIVGLIAGLAGFPALLIGYLVDQHGEANASRAKAMINSLPSSISYHEAVRSSAPWGRRSNNRNNNRISAEEIDKYIAVLDKKINELSKDAAKIRESYTPVRSSNASAPTKLNSSESASQKLANESKPTAKTGIDEKGSWFNPGRIVILIFVAILIAGAAYLGSALEGSGSWLPTALFYICIPLLAILPLAK